MSLTAIIDVGSTSVGGALLLPLPGRRRPVCSRIVHASRNEISFQEKLSPDRFLRGIEAVLKKTLDDLHRAKLGSPKTIVCFLSAPFYAAQTRLIRYVRPEPFAVTRQLVANLAADDFRKLKNVQGQPPHEILESKIIQIKLNGYPVSDPYRRETLELEAFHYFSIASGRVLGRFRQIIEGAFHRRGVEFHSFTFPLARLVGDFLPAPRNHAVILDVGGEITETSLIWQGLPWENFSFPLGCNFVIRRLTEKLQMSPAETRSSLELYLSGKYHPLAISSLETLLAEVQAVWLSALAQALDNVVIDALLPESVYLVGDLRLMPLFARWVTAAVVDQSLRVGHRGFNVVVLKESHLTHFCDYGPGVREDLSLMVETIFNDKLKL